MQEPTSSRLSGGGGGGGGGGNAETNDGPRVFHYDDPDDAPERLLSGLHECKSTLALEAMRPYHNFYLSTIHAYARYGAMFANWPHHLLLQRQIMPNYHTAAMYANAAQAIHQNPHHAHHLTSPAGSTWSTPSNPWSSGSGSSTCPSSAGSAASPSSCTSSSSSTSSVSANSCSLPYSSLSLPPAPPSAHNFVAHHPHHHNHNISSSHGRQHNNHVNGNAPVAQANGDTVLSTSTRSPLAFSSSAQGSPQSHSRSHSQSRSKPQSQSHLHIRSSTQSQPHSYSHLQSPSHSLAQSNENQHLIDEYNHHHHADDSRDSDQVDSPGMSDTNSEHNQHQSQNQYQHIKKPLNPFMIYMQKERKNVDYVKESAAINKILGMRWQKMSKEEQQPYYELARQEKILHSQRYPGWSARDNYANQKKKKKLKLKSLDGLDQSDRKCRARFGLHNQSAWCKPCKRKKKCIMCKPRNRDQQQHHSNNNNNTDTKPNLTNNTNGHSFVGPINV